MKKIIFSLLLILSLALPAAAKHATFLGIEINGSQQNFKRQLLAKGGITYDESHSKDDSFVYHGTYAGYNNCEFYVFSKCGNVYCVNVFLPKATSWRQLKRQFNQTCSEFNGNSSLERTRQEASFEAPYAEGDGDEMLAVENEKCNYISAYNNSTSTIVVLISKYKQVQIIFSDKTNFDAECGDETQTQTQTQTVSSNRMLFMGLPITGTPNQFANRLINEKGFTFSERTESGSVLVKGRFAGFDNCTVGVMLDEDDGSINIGVLIPKRDTWAQLKALYLAFKQELGRKYTFKSSEESFSGSYYDGCGNELEAVRNDKCEYYTKFSAEHGTVAVSITTSCRICIIYLPD